MEDNTADDRSEGNAPTEEASAVTPDEEHDDDEDNELVKLATETVLEASEDEEMRVDRQTALEIAKELIQKFTSPLMMTLAAGATSSVSITPGAGGGIESAHTTKLRNTLFRIKDVAFYAPAALVAAYEGVEKAAPSPSAIVVASVVSFVAFLEVLSRLKKIPLTKQAAGVLHTMWRIRDIQTDIVPFRSLLDQVNAQFNEYEWEMLDNDSLMNHIEVLEKLACIERLSEHNSINIENIRWRLNEAVEVSYQA